MAARILPLLLSAAAQQDTVSVLLDINGAKQPLVIPTRGAVDATVAGLAQRFGKSMADGKRTFYEQLRQPDVRQRYAVATETMVEMFASEEYQSAMAAFLDRK